MYTPKDVPLTIYQGATFQKSWTIVETGTEDPIDLSGYTARMQIREKLKSETVILDLTTENGRITIDVGEETTTLTLYVDPETTAAITVAKGVYDLEIIDTNDDVYRLMQGAVTIIPEVTR
jgi:hypothetical protein